MTPLLAVEAGGGCSEPGRRAVVVYFTYCCSAMLLKYCDLIHFWRVQADRGNQNEMAMEKGLAGGNDSAGCGGYRHRSNEYAGFPRRCELYRGAGHAQRAATLFSCCRVDGGGAESSYRYGGRLRGSIVDSGCVSPDRA